MASNIKLKHREVSISANKIKQNLMLFINCRLDNPSFENLTRQKMTLKLEDLSSTCKLSEKFYKTLFTVSGYYTVNKLPHPIMARIIDFAHRQKKRLVLSGSRKSNSNVISLTENSSINLEEDNTINLTENSSVSNLDISSLQSEKGSKFKTDLTSIESLCSDDENDKNLLENSYIDEKMNIDGTYNDEDMNIDGTVNEPNTSKINIDGTSIDETSELVIISFITL